VNEGELNRLETEVEAARARLTADLDRLRAPATFSSFKSELAAEVQHTKDEWIEKTKDTVNERATQVLDDLKARAAANPLATAAIGAGLLWHFLRHPPITTILVGLGVYGLMRTDPNEPDVMTPALSRAQEIAASTTEKAIGLVDDAREIVDRTSDVARSLGQRAANVAGSLASAGAEVAESVASKGAEIGRSAEENLETWTDQKREAGADALSYLKARTGSLARTTHTAINRVSDNRDGMLLGAAALALVTALGVAYGRQAAERSERTGGRLS
jgi:hypothetical protein